MDLAELKSVGGIPKEKIDQLILNYFIQEGFENAALSFAKEIKVDLDPQKMKQDDPKIKQSDFKLKDLHDMTYGAFADACKEEISNRKEEPQTKRNKRAFVTTQPNMISDYVTINKRKEIKLLILRGDIAQAITKISEYFPSVLDANNILHFKLLRLNLIEKIRNRKLNVTNPFDLEQEKEFLENILSFVRENFISKVTQSRRLLMELEVTMSLLCFKLDRTQAIDNQQDLPEELRSLFSLSLRSQCYRLVNRAILNLYRNEDMNKFHSGNKTYCTSTHSHLLLDSQGRIQAESKCADFDLTNYEKWQEPEGIDIADDVDNADYNYDLDLEDNLNQISVDSQDGDLQPDDENYQSELEYLTLESKLERIIKLWTVAEQRLVDLRIQKEKEYTFLEGS